MVLRCTKMLLNVIGVRQLAAQEPDGNDWYANVVMLERRKCLLLTHAATLFTIFEPDVRAGHLRSTQDLVSHLIERELAAEGLPVGAFGDLGAEALLISKTADRSVLGCMADMAFVCKEAVTRAGGLASTDLGPLNHFLHRNINSARDYQRPIDLVSMWVAG